MGSEMCIRDRYCKANPDTDLCHINRAFVATSFGLAYSSFDKNKDLKKATQYVQEAIKFYESSTAFANKSYHIRDYHANTHGWLADIQLKQKNYNGAAATRQTEQNLYTDILSSRTPLLRQSEGLLQRRFLGAIVGHMRALMGDQREVEALLMQKDAQLAARQLTDYDSENKEWKDIRLRVLILKAIAEYRLGRERDACASWQAAEEYRLSAELPERSVPNITKGIGFEIQSFCE